MALSAVALSFVLIEVDALLDVTQTGNPSALYTFGPEGARTMLSVIASSMITVASLIFSITMLSLQLASSQFGPRTLGNFMRDRSNQIVLGTFIATLLYCLYCIDRLGQVLGRVADRDIPSPMRLDEGGQLRVVTEVFDLGDLTCRAFAAIARYGMIDADVVTRLAQTLAKLEKSFSVAASVAVAELREQMLRESGGPTVHTFDRKILSDLQETSEKKP